MSTFELTVKRIVPASAQDVFEAWLDPEALARFMKPAPGMEDATVEVDAKVGGGFLIVMKAGGKELPHRGEYKIIDRHRRLAFTWLSNHTVPDSTVTLDFVERGPKETEVTLHHVGFPNEEARSNHEGGWSAIMDLVSKTVA